MRFFLISHWQFWFSLSKNSLFFSNIHHVQLFSIFLKTWKNTFSPHAFPSWMSVQNKKHGVKTISRFFWKNFFFISWRTLFTEFITTLKTSLAQKKIFSQKNALFCINSLIFDRISLVCSEKLFKVSPKWPGQNILVCWCNSDLQLIKRRKHKRTEKDALKLDLNFCQKSSSRSKTRWNSL